MEPVKIERKIFGKSTFTNVVDTSFSQLIPVESKTVTQSPVSIDTFFDNYDTLFYDIPYSGSINSHETLVMRSSEHIGVNISDMQEEIRNLREENVSLKRQLFIITNPNK
jgi:hypothetical protein